MINLHLLLQIISLLLWLIDDPLPAAAQSMAKPNCPDVCGDVIMSYPFGIGKGCYHSEWFAITCNESSKKPFLTKANLEVSIIYLAESLVELKIPISVANSNCQRQGHQGEGKAWTSTDFRNSPFIFSQDFNKFTVVGCDNALIQTYDGEVMAGCTSSCTSSTSSTNFTKGCYGINCCQTLIPNYYYLDRYKIQISNKTTANCTYAFLSGGGYGLFDGWYQEKLSNRSFIHELENVPVIVQWGLDYLVDVIEGSFPDYYCVNSTRDLRRSHGIFQYSCKCSRNHYGNPYILNGCKVVEPCAYCEKECFQGPGGGYYCHRTDRSNKSKIILGSSLGGGSLLLVLCGCFYWLYKLVKRRRIIKLKKKFFKKNGGLLLQQQISSDEGSVEKTIVFTSNELEKATDNFNENRILGQGGQGTVYKGMFTDGKIVAIKKSKVVDESQLEQFINEVVILSQINHRNIVKLLGCCLETQIPLLVYEFISNGNLFELIRDQSEEFPLTWKMRLQIAIEVAGALAYLHSASSTPIYHRDIKSTNILLDEKYRAKVADFGTSRTIAIEQTHLTTLVHGTFGYLDPEYFQSSQFTDKSDVYSFGVVLVELLTGKKAVCSINSTEERSLATRFIQYLEESRLFDLLDARVIEEAAKEEVIAVADIAKRCLNLNGKKRPPMKEVMMELEGIRMSHMPLTTPKKFNEDEFIIEMKGSPDHALTSTQSSRTYNRVFSDVDPLLLRTV